MRRALVVSALGAALVFGAGAAGAPTWGAPVQISSGDRALGPELAVSPAGDAAVVWDQEIGPDCADSPASLTCSHVVELTTRKRGSSTWQAPIELGRPGIGDRPRIAIDAAGDAVVAWVHDIGRDRVLQATYRSGSAPGWPEPSDISEPSLEVRDFRVGLDATGDAVAAWAERTEAGVAIRVATRSATSGAWGAAKTLSLPGGYVFGGPSLAVTPGGVTALAWAEDGGVREIRGDSRAGTWGPSGSISAASGASGTPDIDVDGVTQDSVVVWASQTPGSCCEVRAAFYSDSRGWREEGPIGEVRSFPGKGPRVRIDAKGDALAVWASPTGIESAHRDSATDAWSSPTVISRESSVVGDPELALDSRGNAVAAWTVGVDVVRAAIRPAASGEWQHPVELSQPGSSTPRVSLDAAGNALATWNRTSPPRVVVEGAALAGTGPVLSHLTAPRLAIVARARGRFAVRPVPWAAPLAGSPVWKFGDGGSATGAVVSHSYMRPGRFSLTVSQADTAGGVSTSTVSVRVIGARVRNVRPPSIRGIPRVGRTLTCVRGAWAGTPPIRYAYSWRRDGRPVPGRTMPRYRLTSQDAGSLIACDVEASNAGGSRRAESNVVGVAR